VHILYAYDFQIRNKTGRHPRRKPGDFERAEELAQHVGWERFCAVLEFAMHEDTYSLGIWMKQFPTVEVFEATERTWVKDQEEYRIAASRF
jgi:hypothetical protein